MLLHSGRSPPLLFLLLLLLFASAFASAAPLGHLTSSSSDALALLAFKSAADPDNRLRFFFPSPSSPKNNSHATPSPSFDHCRWLGVQCSAEGRVTRLVLEGVGLRGTLGGAAALGRLDQLRILSLKNNSLAGAVPDLSGLTNLKALFLDRNRLTAGFPRSLLLLHRLRTLDLSHNNLSGPFPAGLAAVPHRLYCLRLEANRFTGPVPPISQSSLQIFNVSGNDLSGPVPVTSVLLRFDPSAFTGNPRLCGEVVRRECRDRFFFSSGAPPPTSAPPPAAASGAGAGQLQGLLLPFGGSSSSYSPPSDEKKKKHRRAAAEVGFFGGAFLLIGLVGVLIVLKTKKKKNLKHSGVLIPEKMSSTAPASNAMEMYAENHHHHGNDEILEGNADGNGGGNELAAAAAMMSEDKVKRLGKSGSLVFCAGETQLYTLEQLMRASAEMLGRGSVGTTYKAVLDCRLIVSVKRVDAGRMGSTGKEVFERHMEAVGRLRHPNLVPLRAYFHAKDERLLVYDYQPNGSLFSLIHDSRSTRSKPLHWTSCLKIAEDVAQGLAYIHQASSLVHGNLRSSNVLLGPDFEACLTDNCLAFLVEPAGGEDDSGYRAPETRKSNRRLTPKSDIYAFGVLLLELLTGKPPLQHSFLVATDLPVWVRSVREDEGGEDEPLMMLLDVATACVRSSPESRPTTWQVMKMIQEVKEADVGETDMDPAAGIS